MGIHWLKDRLVREVNISQLGAELQEDHAENQLSSGQGMTARKPKDLVAGSKGHLRAGPSLFCRRRAQTFLFLSTHYCTVLPVKVFSPLTETPQPQPLPILPSLPSCLLAHGGSCQSLKKTALQDSSLLFTGLHTLIPESILPRWGYQTLQQVGHPCPNQTNWVSTRWPPIGFCSPGER